jgi:hypothetical protein
MLKRLVHIRVALRRLALRSFAHIDFYNEAHTLGLAWLFIRMRTRSSEIPSKQNHFSLNSHEITTRRSVL